MSEQSNSKRLFISKSIDELELLPSFCLENDIQLTAHSFLSFEPIPFEIETDFEIVFFASPRSAHFFMSRFDCSNKLIAVAGENTRKFVEKEGFQVHFSPENSGNVTESSLEFSQWVAGRKVLFSLSNLSQKSYSKNLNADQFQTVLTYKTQISTEKIEINSIYVFTSPSNVTGFLASNTIPPTAQIIAWGETTYNKLQDFASKKQLVLMKQSSEEKLLSLLK